MTENEVAQKHWKFGKIRPRDTPWGRLYAEGLVKFSVWGPHLTPVPVGVKFGVDESIFGRLLHAKCTSIGATCCPCGAKNQLCGGSAVGRWTCDLQVVGSIPGWSAFTLHRSTQPCFPPRSLNRVPASAAGKDGILSSIGWQVTLCDPVYGMWVSRSGEELSWC